MQLTPLFTSSVVGIFHASIYPPFAVNIAPRASLDVHFLKMALLWSASPLLHLTAHSPPSSASNCALSCDPGTALLPFGIVLLTTRDPRAEAVLLSWGHVRVPSAPQPLPQRAPYAAQPLSRYPSVHHMQRSPSTAALA